MGIQDRVKGFLSSAIDQFDGEPIVIGGETIKAVIDTLDLGIALGVGAKIEERSLRVQFSTADYNATIRSGDTITARGETWQVSSDPTAILRGQAAITLMLVEPERRNEF